MKPTLFPVVWQPRLRALLYQQFRNLPPKDFSVTPPRSVIEAVSDYFAQEAQELEDAAQEVLSIVSIDDSSGVQLQELGRLVGQPFSGESDALFRLRIRARIAANRSSGDPESLYTVFVAMFALQGQTGQARILSSPSTVAQFVFRVTGFTLDQVTAGVLFDLLSAGTVGGDRLLLEWTSTPAVSAFQCSDANFPHGAFGPGFAGLQLSAVGWSELSPVNHPTARYGACVAYDSIANVILLFGGNDGTNYLNDLWSFTPATGVWKLLIANLAAGSPQVRSFGTMAFDSTLGQVVLFGGIYSAGNLRDTWTIPSGSTTWTQQFSTLSPSSGPGQIMVFYPPGDATILFGTGVGAETWSWDGGTNEWAELGPATSPPVRVNAAMVYDSGNEVLVLFGGNSSSAALNDTWTWNGTTWTNATPGSGNPPIRVSAGMAYDPIRKLTFLFGGANYALTTALNDLWEWNGTAWNQVAEPAPVPAVRYAMGLAFASASSSGELVLFGGSQVSGLLSDTWTTDDLLNPVGGGQLAGAISD